LAQPGPSYREPAVICSTSRMTTLRLGGAIFIAAASFLLSTHSPLVNAATLPIVRPWPLARIPIIVSNDDAAPDVWNAIRELEQLTPVRFVNYTGQRDYVEVVRGGGDVVRNDRWHHNTSDVIGFCEGRSVLHLASGKGWLAMHELGHVLGLVHEHQRADRERFLEVLWSHIEDPEPGYIDWTVLEAADSQGLAYDPNSVMHYGQDWQGADSSRTMRWLGTAGSAGDCIHCRMGWSHLSRHDATALSMLYAKEAALRTSLWGAGFATILA